jgi:peptidoglycan/xylan/chitin deacetylase (PgdA/CDA1 family)
VGPAAAEDHQRQPRRLRAAGHAAAALRAVRVRGHARVPGALAVVKLGANTWIWTSPLTDEGLAVGLWSRDSQDWDEAKAADDIAAEVIAGFEPLGVVLLHDGSETSHRTVQALPDILDAMQEEGYCTGTLTSLERERVADAFFPEGWD